jgi:hypothetical protein
MRNRGFYPWLFLLGCVVVSPVAYMLPPSTVQNLVPAFGLVGGFAAFFYTQHLQQSRLFKELFTEFNKRYDELNAALNEICDRPTGARLSTEDKRILVDYFNLCAEEFLFYRAGYIDNDVWRSWTNGMWRYARNKAIRELWESELKENSYYGFPLASIDRA